MAQDISSSEGGGMGAVDGDERKQKDGCQKGQTSGENTCRFWFGVCVQGLGVFGFW